jgi:hypothetical protein
MHDMLHLLCNATEMKFDLLNEVEMYLLWCHVDIYFFDVVLMVISVFCFFKHDIKHV